MKKIWIQLKVYWQSLVIVPESVRATSQDHEDYEEIMMNLKEPCFYMTQILPDDIEGKCSSNYYNCRIKELLLRGSFLPQH